MIFLGINLQELVMRIEAITAIGIYVKAGRRSNITIKTTTALINWLSLSVAPLATLTAVLTRTPVTGVAPNRPHTRFATARPLTSTEPSNLVPV
jgi:hypothetical protein